MIQSPSVLPIMRLLVFVVTPLIISNVQQCSSLAFTRPTQIYSMSHLMTCARSSDATMMRAAASSKWDNIIYDDDDDDLLIPPKDVDYTPQNIMRQHENYMAISNVGGNETISDVYARDPTKSVFWYVGKVGRCTGTVSIEQAVARLWFLIEAHAARLRQKELAPLMRINNKNRMELWAAPGNSELDVAFNRPHVRFAKIPRPSKQEEIDRVRKATKAIEVGFQGEIYNQGEEGFRTERTDEGLPTNPERTDWGLPANPKQVDFQQQDSDATTLGDQQTIVE